jgi:hypothetical protein
LKCVETRVEGASLGMRRQWKQHQKENRKIGD